MIVYFQKMLLMIKTQVISLQKHLKQLLRKFMFKKKLKTQLIKNQSKNTLNIKNESDLNLQNDEDREEGVENNEDYIMMIWKYI